MQVRNHSAGGKRAAIAILLAVLVLAFASLACSTTTASTSTPATSATSAPHTTPTPAKPKSWVTVASFGAGGNQNTTDFTVNASEWRVVWTCDDTQQQDIGGYFLGIQLNGSDGSYVDLVANGQCAPGYHGGTTTERGAGSYYFAVTATGPWTAKVQVYK